MEKEKYKITHSNTDIKKLWNLARNGVFAYSTVDGIMENSKNGFIIFKSKASYEKYLKMQFMPSALLGNLSNIKID